MLFVAWKGRHRSLETMYQLIQDVFSAEAGYSSTGRLGLNNNAFQMSEYRTGETGTSLLPTRGQATADSGRNRSTAGGYDVIMASLWARWALVARGASIAPPGLCKRTAEHALDGST